MFIDTNYHENKAYHIKWCKVKDCKKCKEYIRYLKEHKTGVYDNYLKGSKNWE